MRKKLLFIVCLLTVCFASAKQTVKIAVERIEPAFWWVGMQNRELQLLVHGENIGESFVSLNSYNGVTIKEIVHPENRNYLFIYLDIAPETRSGELRFNFNYDHKVTSRSYSLLPRATTIGAQGFNPADVLYLIMPDRFANGNPQNDVLDGVKIDRTNPFARHGGDIEGIRSKADYLQKLGVTAIWLNPVLENRMPEGSYHGYAVTDFYRIDPRFGTNGEYVDMIADFHARGMKVVMDMIYNHCGSEHWWMGDFPANDWLNHQNGFVPTTHNTSTIMDIHAPQSEVSAATDGWFVASMPDLNQRNRLLADYLIQNSIWWIEYARIDGIRHDTHPYADKDFLSRWCRRVNIEYPDFTIVGETWFPYGVAAEAWWQRNSRLSGGCNSNLTTVMDFPLMQACTEVFAVGNKTRNPLLKIYEVISQDFAYEDPNNLLVFLDNHDLSRFFKVGETDLWRYHQALSLVLTVRGIPQIYYGTEILMTGEKEDGDGGLRNDFPGGWAEDTVNQFKREGRSELQNGAWDYLQRLLQWRLQNPELMLGEMLHYAPDWLQQCYVYARICGNKRIIVILNGSEQEQKLITERYREVIGANNRGKDIITGRTYNLDEPKIVVPPHGTLILELSLI